MFYFLIFHTSISANKELDKKLLTTFLYGCILYIVLHAILNSSERPFIQMIKQYFWIILGLDVVCMLYIYKSLYDKQQEQGTGSQSIVSKLMEFFDNFIDTGSYRDQIEIQPVPITTTPTLITNNDTPQSILKPQTSSPTPVTSTRPDRKSVDFDINRNTVHELSPPASPLQQPQPELTIPPDNDTLLKMMTPVEEPILSTPINSISKQSATPNSNLGSSSIDEIRKRSKSISPANQQSQLQQLQQIPQMQQPQQPPTNFPPPISAKLSPPMSTKVKQGDNSVKDVKYDPAEFLNNIKYDTTLPSQKTMNTNFLDQDDDKFSTLSKQSDLGSMLDFDLKDFENSL